jgi:hypothetical protein
MAKGIPVKMMQTTVPQKANGCSLKCQTVLQIKAKTSLMPYNSLNLPTLTEYTSDFDAGSFPKKPLMAIRSTMYQCWAMISGRATLSCQIKPPSL